MDAHAKLANFLFEIGTLRKIPRAHRQILLSEDTTDNISSHKFRVTWIGWFLAKLEKADPYKVVMMCLLHDLPETRSGDQNWVHKKYVKVFEDEIISDQLQSLPASDDLVKVFSEYEKRESLEARITKDADIIDQLLLLKEYARVGNREAEEWLQVDNFEKSQKYLSLKTNSAKKLALKIIKTTTSEWQNTVWTEKRR